MTKTNIPSVSVNYACNGSSTKANEMGMRVMQERAYEKRGEQYLIIKSPPASGKSRALMFIALDKLHNQGLKKANGVNILLLWGAAIENGYQNPTWMTFKQAIDYGGHVRKGEKSSLVVYADRIVRTEENAATGEDMEKVIPFLKGYSVFNVEQIEGLPEKFRLTPEPKPESESIQRLEAAETFVQQTGAVIRHEGDRAYYAMHSDHVQMPPIEAFTDTESYYATITHELTHWTKHPTRLDRSFGHKVWGDEGYAKEELVAELGSAFLCADLGITPEIRADHAAYIDNWLQALKNDRKLIFTAASHASKAVEFLKNQQATVEYMVTPSIAAPLPMPQP